MSDKPPSLLPDSVHRCGLQKKGGGVATMLTSICKYCGRKVGDNHRIPASNHVYKHVRVLRRSIAEARPARVTEN
jgi:hypothetical protein